MLLALFPTGLMGLHKFYANDYRQGYTRLIILLLASLFYGLAFQQLLDGNNESFQTLSTIGSIIPLINAVMNLNNIYNAAGEIKRINSRIAEKLVRLIIATDH